MSSKTNNDNRKMSSITRRLNHSFMGKFIWNTVKGNLLLLLAAALMWGYGAEKGATGEFHFRTHREIHFASEENFLEYCIVDGQGREYTVCITEGEGKTVMAVMAAVFIVEFFSFFVVSANMKNTINNKLLPIQEMARETEKISSMAYNEHYFKSLEDAISSVNASGPDVKISTDNKELKGIENALNNLLERMQESYRQQSRFVSDASHELRTPIAVIRGYADMLDRWGKEDAGILEESISAIKNESTNMQKLVEQLLFLARGDSGRNALQIEEFALDELMREVYEETVMIDGEHRYEYYGDPVNMAGDVSMVKQCARILLDNAAKYTASGDTITIRTGKNDEGSFFSVQDNGIGMAEAEVSHIFERFYRSDEARNRKSGGTGLGLSIARWIVDRHNGYFDVLTRQDIGTRITVVFRQ